MGVPDDLRDLMSRRHGRDLSRYESAQADA
jgi:hypothetical protein